MAQVTTVFGLALSLFGARQYVGSPSRHFTGLIPVLFGGLLVLFGMGSSYPKTAKASQSLALVTAITGVVIAGQSLLFPQLFKATSDDGHAHPQRRATQLGTVILCGMLAIFSIGSIFYPKKAR